MRSLVLASACWFLFIGALSGCSDEDDGVGTGMVDSPSTGDDAGTGDGDDASDEEDEDEDDGTDGSDDGTDSSDGDDFEECAGSRTEAERTLRPVDIVWVVDNSGSMDEEAVLVQQEMNDFVASISSSGIDDYHVVLITEESWVTVPDPLGSDTERFRFVKEDVQSNEPLADLLDRFDDYAGFLRADAITHFVVVTDDESWIEAGDFISMMGSKVGHEFKVHVIASPPNESVQCTLLPILCICEGSYGQSAAPGNQHYKAAMMTGGLAFSICEDDWSVLFTELATAIGVSAPIPCELLVPEPEAGGVLDPGLVNVVFTPPDATDGAAIPGVPNADGCGTGPGWYYDDPAQPMTIHLCPSSCTAAEAGGALDIQLGCMTILE
jgi:hypothetical protein